MPAFSRCPLALQAGARGPGGRAAGGAAALLPSTPELSSPAHCLPRSCHPAVSAPLSVHNESLALQPCIPFSRLALTLEKQSAHKANVCAAGPSHLARANHPHPDPPSSSPVLQQVVVHAGPGNLLVYLDGLRVALKLRRELGNLRAAGAGRGRQRSAAWACQRRMRAFRL